MTLKRPYHAALSEHPFEPPNVVSPGPSSSQSPVAVVPAACNNLRPPPSKRRRCVPLREHG